MVKKFNKFGPQLVFAEQTESAIALTNEQKLSIYKKSQKSGISTDILEEVYRRGYSIWNESFGQTAEQFAFDRVNSFIAGGFAANLDEDLMINEGKRGLWDNIHAKRERIKHGSGEHMRKPGSKGAPTAAALKASQTNEEMVAEGSYKTYQPKHIAWVVNHGDGKVSEFKPHEDAVAKAKYDQVKGNRGASIYAIDQHSQSIPMGSLRALRKKQGVAEGERFPEPLTGYHIVYRKTGNVVHGTPSFETQDQAQKYLMTKMFANHQDFEVAHTAGVKEAKRQPETFGGYDPDDFQEKLLRLKTLAGAGPLKTVYDPKQRVYKNIPTAVQPLRQPKK